jgi:hypothetical protein
MASSTKRKPALESTASSEMRLHPDPNQKPDPSQRADANPPPRALRVQSRRTTMPFDPRAHLIQLKGRDYLPVAARLLWLNEETDRYKIETEILRLEDNFAVIRATVSLMDDGGNPTRTATAIKREDKTHFPDFLEKAETGSVGRALGMLGFGTQFAPEFDEIEAKLEARVVDSPQTTRPIEPPRESTRAEPVTNAETRPESRTETRPESRPSLSSIGMKSGSTLGPPTNKRKPTDDPTPATRAATQTVPNAELDVDDGLEEYDHADVADEDLFSEAKVRRLLAIANKLFSLSGDDLEHRVLGAASKILGKSVADLHAMHWKDGNEIMAAIEAQAVKKGVWESTKN